MIKYSQTLPNFYGQGFLGDSEVKNPPGQCRRLGFDPWVGKIPGGENGNPFWYFCLGTPMDKKAWLGYSSLGQERVRHDLETN